MDVECDRRAELGARDMRQIGRAAGEACQRAGGRAAVVRLTMLRDLGVAVARTDREAEGVARHRFRLRRGEPLQRQRDQHEWQGDQPPEPAHCKSL
ncbi:MAG: hypothetical protein WDM85_12090 [Caulobacteraceae bacterium]